MLLSCFGCCDAPECCLCSDLDPWDPWISLNASDCCHGTFSTGGTGWVDAVGLWVTPKSLSKAVPSTISAFACTESLRVAAGER
jgi:hypothetical protein